MHEEAIMRITGINDGVQAEGADGLTISALSKKTKTSVLTEQRGGVAEADTVDISEQGRALAALAATGEDGAQATDETAAVTQGEESADASGSGDASGQGGRSA
jgi:hypothetical protein